jgi:hypothetical protein
MTTLVSDAPIDRLYHWAAIGHDDRVSRRWALGVLGAYCLFAGVALAGNQWNPEWFIHFGHESTVLPCGRDVLGDDVLVPLEQGHDGQAFWLIARDPLLLDTGPIFECADRPVYRYQRILYPALAAPARLLGERALVWALVLINLAAVALGTWWTAILARRFECRRWAPLAFALNPAVMGGVVYDLSDSLAIALLVGGLVAWTQRRDRWAAVAFAGAALTKEVVLLAVVALAVWELRRDRRRALMLAVPAVLVVGTWALYTRIRLGWPPTQIQEFGAPLAGFVDAYRRGWSVFGNYGDMAVAIGVGIAMVALVVLAVRRRHSLLVMAAPFGIIYPLFTAQVLNLPVNPTRGVGPAITLMALGVTARRDMTGDDMIDGEVIDDG